jgi:uridine phosphorylase
MNAANHTPRNDELLRHGYYVNRAFGRLRADISNALGVYVGMCARHGELYQEGTATVSVWELLVAWLKEDQHNPNEGVPARPDELSVKAIEHALHKTNFFALEGLLTASFQFYVDSSNHYRLKVTRQISAADHGWSTETVTPTQVQLDEQQATIGK